MIDDLIMRAWRDATNCYLAGAGLPPLAETEETAATQAHVNAGERDSAESSYCEGTTAQATGESRQTSSRPVPAAIPASGIDVDSELYRSLLRPVEGFCAECGFLTDNFDADNDDWCCEYCAAKLAREQEEDHRLDDPRHGQAKEINRERY